MNKVKQTNGIITLPLWMNDCQMGVGLRINYNGHERSCESATHAKPFG